VEKLDILLPKEKKELTDIKNKKLDIESKIESYQNQLKLLKMIIDRSKIAAHHLKETKTLCGYDDRLAFNEFQFEKWSKSAEGETALKTGVLGPQSDETKRISNRVFSSGHDTSESAAVPDVLKDICLIPEKSKCKHNKLSAWKEVHRTDFHVSLTQLREQLDKLEKKYAGIIERAQTRDATKDYYADNKTRQMF
jgi:COMPASS component SPP1